MANALILNGGGPTPVINESNAGIVEGLLEAGLRQGQILFARYGLEGLLNGDLFESPTDSTFLFHLKNTVSSFPGTSRKKLGNPNSSKQEDAQSAQKNLERIAQVVDQHKIGYLFLVGGDDTATTTTYLSRFLNHSDLKIIGIPKTIDNDLVGGIDVPLDFNSAQNQFSLVQDGKIQGWYFSPGYVSAARFVGREVRNLALEAKAFKRHYIVEVMGREAGFLTAAAKIAEASGYGPHGIFVAEKSFDEKMFAELVSYRNKDHGWGVYVVHEALKDSQGKHVKESRADFDEHHDFVLGGVAEALKHRLAAKYLKDQKLDIRTIRFGEQQRVTDDRPVADRHVAYQVGRHGALYAVKHGQTGKIVTIAPRFNGGIEWQFGLMPAELLLDSRQRVATRQLPSRFLTSVELTEGVVADTIDESFLDYVRPLVGKLPPMLSNMHIPARRVVYAANSSPASSESFSARSQTTQGQ